MPAQEDLWHPTRTLTLWLTAVLAVQAVLQVAQIGQGTPRSFDRLANAFNALFAGHDAVAQARFEHWSDGSDLTLLQIGGYLSTAFLVLVIIWQWRSQTNAKALQRTGARFSPGWGIAGWLIPVVNYVIPYFVFQDLWRSSDEHSEPGAEWRALPGSPLVTSWWITLVVGALTPVIAIALVVASSISAVDTDAFVNAGQRGLGSGGPGWYADPLGRFEHRYWDGVIWTEWVSTKGELAIDTQPVPGYD